MIELNSYLIRLLRSMNHIEKDPNFESATIKFKTRNDCMKLAHPHAIMSVASPTGKAPSPFFAANANGWFEYPGGKSPPEARGVWRENSLTEGEIIMRTLASEGKFNKYTVLVHEGTYFINDWYIHSGYQSKRLSIEIVGTKNVRIVFGGKLKDIYSHHDLLIHGDIDITFKNIKIYQRKPVSGVPVIRVSGGAVVKFVDVKIHAPEGTCLSTGSNDGQGQISLDRCFLTHSWECFKLDSGSISFNNCRLINITTGGELNHQSKLSMKDTYFHFLEHPAFNMRISKLHIENCTLEGSFNYCKSKNLTLERPNPSICIESMARSEVKLISSTFKMVDLAIKSLSTGTKVFVKSCVFDESVHNAFDCNINSSLDVEDCKFHCSQLLCIYKNPNGKVMFRNNSCDHVPEMLKDAMSVDPVHDFPQFTKNLMSADMAMKFYMQEANMQDYSTITKTIKQAISQHDIPDRRNSRLPYLTKFCAYCYKYEIELDDGAKMKYCEKCKLTCYCCIKCQKKRQN